MDIVHFELSGRFGHFLRAEANRDMPSYPIPPRTAVLGLIGAILGIKKDETQNLIEPAHIAVKGILPEKFWITNKFHQSLPTQLSYEINKSSKGSNSEIKNPKMLKQEWLFNPRYELWVSLPEEYHTKFAERLKNRKWHFSPSLGISEHTANLKWFGNFRGEKLPKDEHQIDSAFPEYTGEVDIDKILSSGSNIALHQISMPCAVSANRVFTHQNYYFERNGLPIPVITKNAISVGEYKIIFM